MSSLHIEANLKGDKFALVTYQETGSVTVPSYLQAKRQKSSMGSRMDLAWQTRRDLRLAVLREPGGAALFFGLQTPPFGLELALRKTMLPPGVELRLGVQRLPL